MGIGPQRVRTSPRRPRTPRSHRSGRGQPDRPARRQRAPRTGMTETNPPEILLRDAPPGRSSPDGRSDRWITRITGVLGQPQIGDLYAAPACEPPRTGHSDSCRRRCFRLAALRQMSDMGLDHPADSDDEPEPAQVSPWVRVGAGVIVLAGVAVALLTFRYVDVCDDEVSDSDVVVQVCRHLEVTDPPVLAVGIVVLAALGAFFSEISGLGFTLKRDVRKATDTAQAALRKARRASGVASNAEQTAEVAEDLSRQAHTAPLAGPSEVDHVIDSLAQQYNEARRKLASGNERTREMTAIVSKMISALTEVPPSDFDVSARLGSSDRGQRLAAYAYIYANPDPAGRRSWSTLCSTRTSLSVSTGRSVPCPALSRSARHHWIGTRCVSSSDSSNDSGSALTAGTKCKRFSTAGDMPRATSRRRDGTRRSGADDLSSDAQGIIRRCRTTSAVCLADAQDHGRRTRRPLAPQ